MIILNVYPKETREHVIKLREVLIRATDDFREGLDLPPEAIASLYASMAGQIMIGMENAEVDPVRVTRFLSANVLAGMGMEGPANSLLDTMQADAGKGGGDAH